jgi:hypothetical protein
VFIFPLFFEEKNMTETIKARTIPCPICGTAIDMDKAEIMGNLRAQGYLHVDYWLRCPKCKYSPCFGKEMEDTKPIYWFPRRLPEWYKKAVVKAANKYLQNPKCLFCGSEMELHKVWVNSYRELCDGPTMFITPNQAINKDHSKNIQKYFLPAGILLQYKCTNWRCKYVRYITL